jgi:NAD(P)-dependent dehydrogenase (short-subunit alcohol dehydrogenase family)
MSWRALVRRLGIELSVIPPRIAHAEAVPATPTPQTTHAESPRVRDMAAVVAITGAARGIGRAAASALIADGARVAIGDLDGELTRRVADEIGASGHELDVTDEQSFRHFLDAAEEAHGPLDVLVNNAGIMTVGPLVEEDPAAAARVVAVNLGGTLTGTRLALERMLPRARGHVINVASASSWVTPANLAVYTASKHGVLGLTDAVRAEVRERGVAVTAVFPNVVATDLAAGTRPLRGESIGPDEVGRAIADAVRSRAAEVYVPRSLSRIIRLPRSLPAGARAFVWRTLGVDRLYGDVDPGARAGYMRRIGGRAE